jgi:hypothetical protein
LFNPALNKFFTLFVYYFIVTGLPCGLPKDLACATPALTRSHKILRSNFANIANNPAIALPDDVVKSNAFVREIGILAHREQLDRHPFTV